MLIRFSFKNFKSFKNENCLDMEATSLKEHEYNVAKTENGEYLKVSAIYGANASGKTNVLQAFDYMKKRILVSDDSKKNSPIDEENIYSFMINNAPIALEVEILAKNNKIYKYGFEVLKDTIISEWLFEKRVNKFYAIFERENNNVSMKPNKISDLVNIDERTLFLNIYSKIDRNNEDFSNVYDWFVNSMYLDLGNPNFERFINNRVSLKILSDENYKKELLKSKELDEQEMAKISKENEEKQAIIDEFASSNKDSQAYIDNLNEDITDLKISVSSFNESEMSIQEMSEMINKEIETHTKNVEIKKAQIEKDEKENIELEKQIEETKKQIEEIKSQVSNSGENIEKLKKDRIVKNEKLTKKEDEQTDEFKVIEDLKAQVTKLEVKKTKIEEDITEIINKMWEEYELTPNNAGNYPMPENVQLTQRKVNNLRTDIRELGSVNVDSIEEYKNLKQRYDFMCEQRLDLESTMAKLNKVIAEMLDVMKTQFKEKFEIINKNFGEVFKELFGGGMAEVSLTDENNILESGIEINVQPPGKKLQSMLLLSGGERAFTAIALLFAILKINPAPFCVLDEIEAALDDVNVYRYAEYLKKFAKDTQFLIITHRKGTMEAADTIYGVTMEEKGISKLLSMKLKET